MPTLTTYGIYPLTKSLEDITKELTVELHTYFGNSYKAVFPDPEAVFPNPGGEIEESIHIHWDPPAYSKDYRSGNNNPFEFFTTFGKTTRIPRRVYRIYLINNKLHLVKGIQLFDKKYTSQHEEVLGIIQNYMEKYVEENVPYPKKNIWNYRLSQLSQAPERIATFAVCLCVIVFFFVMGFTIYILDTVLNGVNMILRKLSLLE